MAQNAKKLMSEKIAARIRELQEEQRAAEEREDREADALLLRLAHRSRLRDVFIQQARTAIHGHERVVAAAPGDAT
ncbi:MAG TPA: hypothetical protein VF292_08295 [Rhodanobacteraceae bacterium]